MRQVINGRIDGLDQGVKCVLCTFHDPRSVAIVQILAQQDQDQVEVTC